MTIRRYRAWGERRDRAWGCLLGAAALIMSMACGASALPAAGNPPLPGFWSNAGKFLVASRGLDDPRFSETVVLILSHDLDGAIGIIINRPSQVKLSEIFPEVKGLARNPGVVYFGGPVELEKVFLMVRGLTAGQQKAKNQKIFDGVYLTSDKSMLQGHQKSGAHTKFRAYAGYAGWAPGQLENEIERGDWYVMPARAEAIFDQPADGIWPDLIEKAEKRLQVLN